MTRAKPPGPKPTDESGDINKAPSAAQVLRQFRLVFNAVRTHFKQVENAASITGAQAWALSVVAENPGISMGGLARAMDVHQSTASNLAKGLVECGLLAAYRSDEGDRRAVKLSVLPTGLEVLHRTPKPLKGVLAHALSELDDEILLRLEQDLGSLLSVMRTDQRAAKKHLSDL